MGSGDIGMEVLLPHECLQLLAGHVPKVGRVGVIHDNRPNVLPVNCAVVEGAVIFRTGQGELAAAVDGAFVAFEVDSFDPSWEEGWSVVVHGHAERLRNDEAIDHLSGLLAARGSPWSGPTTSVSCRRSITGRSIDVGRLRRTDVPSWVERPGDR